MTTTYIVKFKKDLNQSQIDEICSIVEGTLQLRYNFPNTFLLTTDQELPTSHLYIAEVADKEIKYQMQSRHEYVDNDQINTTHKSITQEIYQVAHYFDNRIEAMSNNPYRNKSLAGKTQLYHVSTGHTNISSDDLVTAYTTFEDNCFCGTYEAHLIQDLSPGIQLLNVKLFDHYNGSVTVKTIADVFHKLISHQKISNTRLMCMPVSLVRNDMIVALLDEFTKLGVVIVTGAGVNHVPGKESEKGFTQSMTFVNDTIPANISRSMVIGEVSVNNKTNLPDDKEIPLSFAHPIDCFALKDGATIPWDERNAIRMYGPGIAAVQAAALLAQHAECHPDMPATLLKQKMSNVGILGGAQMFFDHTSCIKQFTVMPSIITGVDKNDFAERKGYLTNIKNGNSKTVLIGLNPDAYNVEELEWSPLPPWITYSDGEVNIDLINYWIKPGLYVFILGGMLNNEYHAIEYVVDVTEDHDHTLYEDLWARAHSVIGFVGYIYNKESMTYDQSPIKIGFTS